MPGLLNKKNRNSKEFLDFIEWIDSFLVPGKGILFSDKLCSQILESLNTKDHWMFDVALVRALKEGHLNNLKLLNRDKKLVKFINNSFQDLIDNAQQRTPLGFAARYGHLKCVKYLHKLGADVNCYSADPGYRRTALHEAVDNCVFYENDKNKDNQVAIVKYLLDNGADLCAKDTKTTLFFYTHNTALEYGEKPVEILSIDYKKIAYTSIVYPNRICTVKEPSPCKSILRQFHLLNITKNRTHEILAPLILPDCVEVINAYLKEPNDFDANEYDKRKNKSIFFNISFF